MNGGRKGTWPMRFYTTRNYGGSAAHILHAVAGFRVVEGFLLENVAATSKQCLQIGDLRCEYDPSITKILQYSLTN